MLKSLRSGLALAVTAIASFAAPSFAADTIQVRFGPASRSLSVDALATYAETGRATENLGYYLNLIGSEQAAALRDTLTYEVPLNFVPFARFTRSRLGTGILDETADIIQPLTASVDGTQALRAALVTSTSDGSFTLLELLQRYPSTAIVINSSDVRSRVDGIQSVGDDLQLLLASFGVNVDVSQVASDPESIGDLLASGGDFLNRVETFATRYGISELDLNAPVPPTGEIEIPKAALYNLYQQFLGLGAQTGVEVEIDR
ncbi:MAG: alpha/beta hydrolase [Cyanobacteria bacterium J06639_1]